MFLNPEEDFTITSEQIQKIKENEKTHSTYKNRKREKHKKVFKVPQAKFDPNEYNAKDWMKLGLSEKQANVVVSFASRGIYSNDQLEKIFVIPKELYALIKDSTFYPEKKLAYEKATFSKEEKKKVLVELNGSDQMELETIPGIGPFYAKNIVKYRDRLGGFVRKEQLLEVWKMEVEKYDAIEEFVKVDAQKVKKIPLNSITAEQLKSHPYLNWNIANSIIKIREKKGSFSRIDEIRESVLIDEELFEKIKPYLSL
jgi:DNA uptake protein ComE-like DNA-binding protein